MTPPPPCSCRINAVIPNAIKIDDKTSIMPNEEWWKKLKEPTFERCNLHANAERLRDALERCYSQIKRHRIWSDDEIEALLTSCREKGSL